MIQQLEHIVHYSLLEVEICTRVNGINQLIVLTARELLFGLMVNSMRATGRTTNAMEKAELFTQMVKCMKASCVTINIMEREKRHGQMVDNMRVTTSRERERDQANTGMLMDKPTMDNIRTITFMATEYTYGLMLANMKASG